MEGPGMDSINWDELAELRDYISGPMNSGDYPTPRGSDHSAGIFHNSRAIASQPSNQVHTCGSALRDVVAADPSPRWAQLQSGQEPIFTFDFDVWFGINNINGAWVSNTERNVEVHCVKSEGWLAGDQKPRWVTMVNESPTHAVIYNLHHCDSGQVIWQRKLNPKQIEKVTIPFDEGTVRLLVLAGPKMPGAVAMIMSSHGGKSTPRARGSRSRAQRFTPLSGRRPRRPKSTPGGRVDHKNWPNL
ncbi:hypothetical protein PtA15_1A102 [Puccinia triticina]|nr:uncharacterized protein PtA15_1A102 [Puccinia triticina]WAQ80764.1 hypothetical protein PtA15_1A102 [Puccinia triticina]